MNVIWPVIKKHFNKSQKLLDMASGNGRFGLFFSGHVKTVYCVDPGIYDPPAEIVSKGKDNILHDHSTLQNYEGKDFDIVWAFGFFSMFRPPESEMVLVKLLSFLKDDGVLFITDDWGNPKPLAERNDLNAEVLEEHSLSSANMRLTVIKKMENTI